jgi:hypothetical protein
MCAHDATYGNGGNSECDANLLRQRMRRMGLARVRRDASKQLERCLELLARDRVSGLKTCLVCNSVTLGMTEGKNGVGEEEAKGLHRPGRLTAPDRSLGVRVEGDVPGRSITRGQEEG